MAMRVDQVTSADVLAVIGPVWRELPATGRKVRRRLSITMRWAVAAGYRNGDPAAEAVLAALPKANGDRRVGVLGASSVRHVSLLGEVGGGGHAPSSLRRSPRPGHPQRPAAGTTSRVVTRRRAPALRASRDWPYTRIVTPTAATWRYTKALTVPALAAEMLDPSWRHSDRPLVQFVMDWRRFPDQRDMVLAEAPPADTDAVVAAKIAAVLHATLIGAGCWTDLARSSPPRSRRSFTPCASATGSPLPAGSTGIASTRASPCSVPICTPHMVNGSVVGPRARAPSTVCGSMPSCSTRRCPKSAQNSTSIS